MMIRQFTQSHIKRQKLKVLLMTNASLAAFLAKSRASKINALLRTDVTIRQIHFTIERIEKTGGTFEYEKI